MASQTDCKKNTVLIIYTAGSYGTFLDWCINYFAGQIPVNQLPFQTDGSAHGWQGCATGDVTLIEHRTIDWWLSRPDEPFVLRTHMDAHKYLQRDFLAQYAPRFKKVILLCNHVDCHLLFLQNILTKIISIDRSVFLTKIIDRFRKQFNADQDIPRWQLREMLSYWHEDWHCFMTDLYQPSDHPMVINIQPRTLICDFEHCMMSLFDELEIKMTRQHLLVDVKNQWLALQQFKDIDQHCRDIVHAVVTNQNISTQPCNNDVISESFVLYELRVNHNLDIACTGLDHFLLDTQTLRTKLLPYINHH